MLPFHAIIVSVVMVEILKWLQPYKQFFPALAASYSMLTITA
jgi:hypothetical protein